MTLRTLLTMALMWPFLPDQHANAATITVCKANCNYVSIQDAISAAETNDTILISPGTYYESLNVVVGMQQANKDNIKLWTSGYQSLPPEGVEIDPKDPSLVRIITTNGNSALNIGNHENVVSEGGVDTVRDILDFDTGDGFQENEGIVCFGSDLPAPLAQGIRYFIKDWNPVSKEGRLSTTPSGPAIDILSLGASMHANYYHRPRCTRWKQPHSWNLRGLSFECTEDAPTYFLVNLGRNEQPVPAQGPNRWTFRQVVVHSPPSNPNAPMFGMALLAGSGHRVLDFHISGIKCGGLSGGGCESKGIWLQNVDDVIINNGTIQAASINLMTAGGDSARGQVVSNIKILGNRIIKPGNLMFKSGPDIPAGECYYGGGSGAFYYRTGTPSDSCKDGACYSCTQNGTWGLDTSATLRRSSYLTKNLMELKDCENCLVEGNYLQGSFLGPDAGQGGCMSVMAGTGDGFGSAYHKNHNVTFRNNWCDHVYSGLAIASGSINGAAFKERPLENIVVDNNLVTNAARYPALSQWDFRGAQHSRGIVVSQGASGIQITRNTFRPAFGATFQSGILFGPGGWPTDNMIHNLRVEDNLFQFEGVQARCAFCISYPPATTGGCTYGGFWLWSSPSTIKRVRNNIFTGGDFTYNDFINTPACKSDQFEFNYFDSIVDPGFISVENHRLSPSSKVFGLGANGRNPGADIDLIETLARPNSRMSVFTELKLIAVRDASKVTLSLEDSIKRCSVALYSNVTDRQKRISPIASYSDSISMGTRRTVVWKARIGAQYLVTCGATLAAGEI